MSANSRAYITVFTVYSLPVHVSNRQNKYRINIRAPDSFHLPISKLILNLITKSYKPISINDCLFINHQILTSIELDFVEKRIQNFPARHAVFLNKRINNHRKMRLGKPNRIAYIYMTMHDAVKDEQLMLQYKDGDSRAFEVLYSRYRLPMFRYLQNQCGNAAIAEEIFQDVWMNLVRARERYEVTASFKTYIYRLAHNRLIDHYRKQKHGVPSSYDEHEGLLNMNETANHVSPQRHVAVEQQVDKLLDAIAQLPEAQREAFLLKEETGLSVEEIATMTDVKPETAKSRIRYAMNKLKEAVEIEHYG